jgi:hypothetical protein
MISSAMLCQPINPCAACHPWSIAPGDQQPLYIDWGGWLASVLTVSISRSQHAMHGPQDQNLGLHLHHHVAGVSEQL